MKLKTWIALGLTLSSSWVFAQTKSSIDATVDGYNGKMISFDFMQNSKYNKQYTYIPNNPMGLTFELTELEMVKLNNYVWLLMEPGDKLDIAVTYDGRNYKNTEFKGTEKAVFLNKLIMDMRNSRIANNYKMNPMAAVAVQVTVEDYVKQSMDQWALERGMLEANKAKISPEAYNYIYSELEGTFLSNYLRYPLMHAGRDLENFKDVAPADYCQALDNLKLRTDASSLKSRPYMTFLLDYKDYKDRCKALSNNEPLVYERDMKKYYDGLVSFYEGNLREVALFVYLYNCITSERDFDEIEVLVKDFVAKHNKQPYLKQILEGMLK